MSSSTRLSRFVPTGHDGFLLIAVLLIILVFAVQDPAFLSLRNGSDVFSTYSVLGILAAGLLIVLISGELDISFTAVMTAAQYASAVYIIENGGSWVSVFATSIFIGVALGMLNALIVHYLNASSVIVTIATLNIYFGATVVLSGGEWLYAFPDWFFEGVSIELWSPERGRAYAINLAILALAAFWALTYLLLYRSSVGRQIFAVGGNREAAERVGINILRIRLLSFGFLGLAAGVAAVVHAQLVQTVAPNALVGTELEVLAAVVLGGASLTGGVGTFRGMVLGVAFIALMSNGLVITGVSTYSQKALLGLVIVIAVIATGDGGKLFRKGGRRV